MGGRVIWVGTCGFGRRQSDVFRDLHVVEIQQTFYRPVSVELARKWRAAAPPRTDERPEVTSRPCLQYCRHTFITGDN